VEVNLAFEVLSMEIPQNLRSGVIYYVGARLCSIFCEKLRVVTLFITRGMRSMSALGTIHARECEATVRKQGAISPNG
jgi:hypothetical protein